MWQRETEAEKKKRRRKQGGRGRRRLRVCGGRRRGRRSETLAVKLVEKFPFPALLFPFPRYYHWQGIKNALKCFPPPPLELFLSKGGRGGGPSPSKRP